MEQATKQMSSVHRRASVWMLALARR